MTGLTLLSVSALRGPNIWARFPVLEVWVDLHDLADSSSDEIPGFNDRLKGYLPGLVEHRCSVGERGGFFQRLARGTYMAHIFEHVVLELQWLAGVSVGYGKTRMTSKDGVYKIGIEYENEELGRAACEFGRDVCMAAVHGTPIDIAAGVAKLKAVYAANRPSPLVENLLAAAKRHGVPAAVVAADDGPGKLVRLGWGANQRRVLDGQTDRTSGVGASAAGDRELTRLFLQAAGVPVPGGRSAKTADEAWSAAESVGLPVVLRPKYTSTTAPATAPLHTEEEVRAAFDTVYTAPGGWTPVVDPVTPGESYRVLAVGGQVAAAMDSSGNPVDVSPGIAERVADAVAALKLDVAAVEVVTPDVAKSLEETRGTVIGVDAAPDLTAFPTTVADAIVKALFPDPRASRIPTVGVTGTNGKTTTTRLVAHLMGQVHEPVGFTCTEGIFVAGKRVETGDCSGPKSAKFVLRHPDVRAAVLETARGGILREGLGFDRCDVAVVTNLDAGDHLGSADIETVEQLADVKGTLVWGVAKWGTAVLNAADPLVVGMRAYCDGTVTFFARDPANAVIREHLATGGRAVYVRDNAVILAAGDAETVLVSLENVPLTHGGLVPFQVENVLAASAAAWAAGVPLERIAAGLESFRGGVDHAPGRFNLFAIDGLTIVADYGHNVSALHRLLSVLAAFPHEKRSIVYSAAGDRRDVDIIAQGEMLGRHFDRVFLYEDTYLRGRKDWEIANLFKQGISLGDRTKEVYPIKGSLAAILRATETATPGELLVVQPDTIDDGIAFWNVIQSRGGREITMSEAVACDVEIRESRFGRAAHAGRAFAPGDVVVKGRGPVIRERTKYTIQVDRDLHVDTPDPIRLLNHSCDPNCGILVPLGTGELEVHALRDIEDGEELTLDYETFETEFRVLTGPCLCLAPNCRGKLRGYAYLPQDRREYFGKYVAEYLREADIPVIVRADVVAGS